MRYLHRILVHAFYLRKQADIVTEEDMRLLYPATRPYANQEQLTFSNQDHYAKFGMVSFFVSRLEHYRDWAWFINDKKAKIGIGGLITPLLEFQGVRLGTDAAGPYFIDAAYLRSTTYFSGKYNKIYVYY